METAPLSRGEVYYEPTGGEPVSVSDTHPAHRHARGHVGLLPALISDWTAQHQAPLCISFRGRQSALKNDTKEASNFSGFSNIFFPPLPTLTEPGRRDRRSPERRRRSGPGQRPGVVRCQHRPRRELRVLAHVRVGETRTRGERARASSGSTLICMENKRRAHLFPHVGSHVLNVGFRFFGFVFFDVIVFFFSSFQMHI